MNYMNLARVAEELARLAEALRAAVQAARPPDLPALEALAHTAPPDLHPLVQQTLAALASRLPAEGARVLIVGLHRQGDRTASWYQLFTEQDAEKTVNAPQGLRSLALLAQPERLRLLWALVHGAQRTAEIMERTGLTQGQFYHHLRALELAGLARKLARDRYTPTASGISALFMLLALMDYLEKAFSEEEGEAL